MKLSKRKFKFTAKPEKILGHFKIASPEETIDKILKDGSSIARFGDGEFDFIYGVDMNYQKMDEDLSRRLKEVLLSKEENLIIGIPNVFNLEYCDKYIGRAIEFWPGWVNAYKFKLLKLLERNRQYYSAQISRFYLDYIDKSHVGDYVKKLKLLWDNKDIVIIEGTKSRLGVGNDLFKNAKSIQRIICPAESAYSKYEEIMNEAKKVSKDKIIFLALGPTATVLAYDLYKLGYQAIDIGHVDIEYEWFLRKATKKIKIENKYVTEVADGRTNIEDVTDEKYKSEIIATII